MKEGIKRLILGLSAGVIAAGVWYSILKEDIRYSAEYSRAQGVAEKVIGNGRPLNSKQKEEWYYMMGAESVNQITPEKLENFVQEFSENYPNITLVSDNGTK